MKIITQISMFDDTQNENLGDLELFLQQMVKQYKALQLRYPKTKVETGEKEMQHILKN